MLSQIDLPRLVRAALLLAPFIVLWPLLCFSQTDTSVLCNRGTGHFAAEFRSGVKVQVGAARNAGLTGFATRACAARLSWEKQELIVSANAAELDLDAFGVDLGYGIPVAAFQIKKSVTDCCMDYQIYSLERPPRLLRTIKGGEFVSAADTDLDGNVEIWTNDAAALDGFEKLTLAELDSIPIVVFRLKSGELWDVSAEFQSYFDNEISKLRGQIDRHDLDDFKNSDGKLTATPTPATAERLHRLRVVKTKVLEILWEYLYSGREQEAWQSLAQMWPSADTDRIRLALLNVRQHGIHAQADGTSKGRVGKLKRTHVFDVVRRSVPDNMLEVVPPEAILLEYPPVSENQQPGSEVGEPILDLVVDESGKVRSVTPSGKANWIRPEVVNAASNWKFIPAFKNGKAVASRMRIALSPQQ